MAKDEYMPVKSFGLLKSIAKARSKKIANSVPKTSSLPSGILDYVDLPNVDEDMKSMKMKSRRHVCHPVVVIGLVTTILYIIFMTLLVGYFYVPKIKEILDSLKRLANIKEWLRIIFKPWYNSEKTALGGGGGRSNNYEREPDNVGPHLNPEFDVNIY